MKAAQPQFHPHERRTNTHLLIAMLGAPIAWLIYLLTGYLLVQYACSSGNHVALHLASGFFLACTIAVGVLSWKEWSKEGRRWPSDTDEGLAARRGTMSVVGLLQSGLFTLLVIVSWIAMFILHPCAQ